MNPSTIIALVQNDLFEREQRGLNKYGTTVDRNDLTEEQWLQHAYEEALDLAVYLKKTIQSKKGIEKPVPKFLFTLGDLVRIKKTGVTRRVIETRYNLPKPIRLSNNNVYKEDELELIEE